MKLLQKLQIKNSSRIRVRNAPTEILQTLENEGWKQSQDVPNAEGLLVFCGKKAEIENISNDIIKALSDQDLCWIGYPKRNGKVATDITRDEGWQVLADLGWLPVRLVSLNDNWSALRFKPRSEIKSLKRGTDYPGIDRHTKTVELPEGLRRTLAEQSLVRAFERCSFSQRREWVVGILEAKREKTRINRIKQVVDDLTSN